MTRVSVLIGILQGLRVIFADAIADHWPKLDNKGPLFNRTSPVNSMIQGGLPQMLDVRR